jgi:hypothetical protein
MTDTERQMIGLRAMLKKVKEEKDGNLSQTMYAAGMATQAANQAAKAAGDVERSLLRLAKEVADLKRQVAALQRSNSATTEWAWKTHHAMNKAKDKGEG